ncbi:unnamed protein product [Rotaria sp. Silwood1]|nr:unnamed protein product [Rotaria sp. Silwood1]CAF1626411.1 unnamed protein product [Rotaria sp. Silwood1]
MDTSRKHTINQRYLFGISDEPKQLLEPISGTFLEVKSQLNPAPDLHVIHLQQKIPPHVLLEPPFESIS